MPDYRLSVAADQDLEEIYSYSSAKFDVRSQYLRFEHQCHSVYYKPVQAGILVVRILGPGMSADRNLP